MGLAAPQESPDPSKSLVRTCAWLITFDDRPAHALEGNVLSTGATILWLSRLLDCDVNELDCLARTVDSSAGVNLVPAFAGLGATWWDRSAKAVISGFDLGTTSAHFARAAFESIALQIEAALEVEKVAGNRIDTLLADGGPSRTTG